MRTLAAGSVMTAVADCLLLLALGTASTDAGVPTLTAERV